MTILTSFWEKLPPSYITNQFLCQGSLQVTGFTDKNFDCPAQNLKRYHFPPGQYYTHTALLLLHTRGPFAWERSCFCVLPVNSMLMRLHGIRVFHQQYSWSRQKQCHNSSSSSRQSFIHRRFSISHWFHFSRSEIFMPRPSLCPPFLVFREERNEEKERAEEELTPRYHFSCCTILPVLSWHMSTWLGPKSVLRQFHPVDLPSEPFLKYSLKRIVYEFQW